MANTAQKILHMFDHKVEASEATATEAAVDIKNGPAAAAIFGSGLGVAFLGIATFLAETFPAVKEAFKLKDTVGPLSGKTTYAIVLWLVAWGVLHYLWRDRDVKFGKAIVATIAAIAVGLILTFPPVFLLFAAE